MKWLAVILLALIGLVEFIVRTALSPALAFLVLCSDDDVDLHLLLYPGSWDLAEKLAAMP